MFPLTEKSLLWTIAKSGVMTTFGAQSEKIRENNRQGTRMKIRNLFVTTPFYKISLCLPLTSNSTVASPALSATTVHSTKRLVPSRRIGERPRVGDHIVQARSGCTGSVETQPLVCHASRTTMPQTFGVIFLITSLSSSFTLVGFSCDKGENVHG